MAPSSRRPVVVSIGGSVLRTGTRDVEYLVELADLLRELGRRRPIAVTVGGGASAREYIRLGREVGLTEVELDEIGIEVTRIHARLLAARIGPPTPGHPPATIGAAVQEIHRASPVVMGGTEPGHTTDGVAALLAVRLRAERLINATRVDGVYDRDPRAHPEARRFPTLSFTRFKELVDAGASTEAGQEFPFDLFAARTLARTEIPVAVLDGRDLANLERAIEGRSFVGTRIEADRSGKRQ